jgi:hypothetical protein
MEKQKRVSKVFVDGIRIGWRENSRCDKIHKLIFHSELMGITLAEAQEAASSFAKPSLIKQIFSECVKYGFARKDGDRFYPVNL